MLAEGVTVRKVAGMIRVRILVGMTSVHVLMMILQTCGVSKFIRMLLLLTT